MAPDWPNFPAPGLSRIVVRAWFLLSGAAWGLLRQIIRALGAAHGKVGQLPVTTGGAGVGLMWWVIQRVAIEAQQDDSGEPRVLLLLCP